MTINIHQTSSEIYCAWNEITNTETGKPVGNLNFFKLLPLFLYICLKQMKPAVSECNISMFREQDLSFNLRSSF